jgi:hypothetical protein
MSHNPYSYLVPSRFQRHRRSIPSFHTVPVRIRADGWTPLRQAEFIGHLAETRSVRAAAERVGMARETAYRLRRKPGAASFRAAWDAALGNVPGNDGTDPARKVTLRELQWQVETGLWQVLMRGGRYVGVRRKADDSALLRLLARTGGGRRRG